MKLIRHGTEVVAIIQQSWEKAYLLSKLGKQEWVPLFREGEAIPFAEIHSESRQVRLCEGRWRLSRASCSILSRISLVGQLAPDIASEQLPTPPHTTRSKRPITYW